MRHIRIPKRERIRKSEVVKLVDNTQPAIDPHEAILYHLEQVKQIIRDSDTIFSSRDLKAIKRSITAIENKVNTDDEQE